MTLWSLKVVSTQADDLARDFKLSKNVSKSSSQFLASAFTTPSFENLVSADNNESDADANLVVVRNDNRNDVSEEIRPMESYSNTGYGMWMGSSEDSEIIEESAPLDGGNTISDQMSRLFPISLNH